MAAVARRSFLEFSKVEIVVSAFEDWPLPAQQFDHVVSTITFHWVDENIRMAKAADILKEGCGALAVISTHHIKRGSEAFFVEVLRFYERFGLAPVSGLCLPAANDVPEDPTEFEREKCFGPVEFQRFEWEKYGTGEYLNVLSTYSSHRSLEKDVKDALLSSIEDLIDNKYQGRIIKRYIAQLAIANRL
jgi:ubiquinone/menaquinone biosynthesis C-methylase UbiE